jgi:hypothetical protein
MNEHHTYYIAPGGDDQSPGTKDQPFRTLTRAQAAVRERLERMNGDISVYLRGGEYRLSEPFKLSEKDSGRNGYKVRYSAYMGETATLSGGIPVKGWVQSTDSRGRALWQTSLPELDNTRHLIRDGVSLSRPRSEARETNGWDILKDENLQFWNPIETVSTFDGYLTVFEGYRSKSADMASWRNPSDIEFVYDVGWTHSICPVDSIESDVDGAIIRMRMPCFRDCLIKNGVRIGTPSYYENVFELMDKPGEWYFDRESQILYYFAENGENPNVRDFIIPQAEQLLSIEGTREKRAENIEIDGLTFLHTTWLLPAEFGFAEIQANTTKDPADDAIQHLNYIKPETAVTLSWTCNITFKGNRFSLLGNGAIDIGCGCRETLIEGNVFNQIAGSGVQIGSFHMIDSHPEDEEEIVGENRVENNVFHAIGTEYNGSVAVIAGFTEGTSILHNEISHCSYSGVSVGWGWAYSDPGSETRYVDPTPGDYPRFITPSVMRNNVIAYNHIHHVLQHLHDGGAIYTLSLQPGSSIRGNYIHDNGDASNPYPGEVLVHNSSLPEDHARDREYTRAKGFPGGIYMDEGTGGFEVTDNILHNIPIPIFYHKVLDHRFETNHVHGNTYNISPGDDEFPADAALQAGLLPAFRHLLRS